MLGWFILGVLLGAAVASFVFTVEYLTCYIMEQKLREVKKQVKDANTKLGEMFTYMIKERRNDMIVVNLFDNQKNEVAEVNITSEKGIANNLQVGLCNWI